jgi:nitroimidazol reductase NimA-like FMN-containing flavoprotein (pyridoxamine 5'-phosphate oxidase superfamily)
MRRTATKAKHPKAARPHMPGYGLPRGTKGLLRWTWAEQRLRRSHNYWMMTVRPGAKPHAMPVWGIWVDNRFYFSTGARSRKARNLQRNSACIVCTERTAEAVIVEGRAAIVSDAAVMQRLAPVYYRKYKPWKLDPEMGPIFEVRPQVAFAMYEKRFKDATRYRFDTAPAKRP